MSDELKVPILTTEQLKALGSIGTPKLLIVDQNGGFPKEFYALKASAFGDMLCICLGIVMDPPSKSRTECYWLNEEEETRLYEMLHERMLQRAKGKSGKAKELKEAGSMLHDVACWFRDNVYPQDIFVGCDDCTSGSCECDPGVKWCRIRQNAIETWESTAEVEVTE